MTLRYLCRTGAKRARHLLTGIIQAGVISLAKDMVRAHREGDGELHLNTVKSILPYFATFDKVNYFRWCSVYMEYMFHLETCAPEVFEAFMGGKFVVKRTTGSFNAIGVDICLEQTKNKSQKSSSGIIGNIKRRSFVAQWELIYHEMLLVRNHHRELCETEPHY